MIRLLAQLVPQPLRRDWENEWNAELWYRARTLSRTTATTPEIALELLRYGRGAARDAFELRLGAPDEWRAQLYDSARWLAHRPRDTVAASGVLALTLGVLTPLLLLSSQFVAPHSTSRSSGPALRAFFLALGSATTVALVASAAHAARALMYGARDRDSAAWTVRLVDAFLLTGSALLPGAALATAGVTRLPTALALGSGPVTFCVLALVLAASLGGRYPNTSE